MLYKMKFMFDWGSEVCLWSTNQAAKEKFGTYPVSSSLLPISDELKNELEYLIELHDKALNWDEPNSGLLWNDEQINDFLNNAEKTYNRLCMELGKSYEIELIKAM